MAHEIRIPRLGWSSEECKFLGWLKKPDDHVAIGDPLFEVESEKALSQIESVDAGQLSIPEDCPLPGSVVPVGAILGYLLLPGELTPDASGHQGSLSSKVIHNAEASHATSPTSDASAPADPGGSRPLATPRAKRIAGDLGVDWRELQGTGEQGRVREADVRAALISTQKSHSDVHASSASVISPRRKSIADHLRASRERSLPVTLTTIADATNMVALREQFKASRFEIIPSYNDIVACLVTKVLRRHPAIASRWDNEHRHLTPVSEGQMNIGIAVDTEEGLLVPVLHDLARKSLLDVARESKAQIDSARRGRLTASDMQGGVFTITNLGSYNIDGFTPMINAPEIAILGLGSIRRIPVVMPDNQIVPRHQITLSLTFDHAAVDGAPAAAFLKDIAVTLENLAAHLLGE